MDAEFWFDRWDRNDIGFHEGAANALLVAHFGTLDVPTGGRVFVPLCGKTLDITWLLSRGYRVAGAELSEVAITQLFDQLGLEPAITETGALKHYSARNIDIFVGDIFEVSRARLGPIDAIYDRAALVALPGDLRRRYSAHLKEITAAAPQLLLCFEYNQAEMDGPPFSICDAEVGDHYRDSYRTTLVASKAVPGGIKGKCAATEKAWLLQPA